MREIKFRAFVSKESKYKNQIGMIEPETLKTMLQPKFTNIPGEWCWDEIGLIFMQFTGLQDKNGVDIYEGDIIRLFNNNSGYTTVVFKNQYVGGWILFHEENSETSLGARKPDDLEVLGNIHSNPELLK